MTTTWDDVKAEAQNLALWEARRDSAAFGPLESSRLAAARERWDALKADAGSGNARRFAALLREARKQENAR